jgi:hypothetical protein
MAQSRKEIAYSDGLFEDDPLLLLELLPREKSRVQRLFLLSRLVPVLQLALARDPGRESLAPLLAAIPLWRKEATDEAERLLADAEAFIRRLP